MDPHGNVVGDPFRVNTDESSDMVPGGIAMAPDGRYVIVWYGSGPGHDGTDIYARRYNADDTPADAVEFRVNQFTSGLQWYPTVSMDSDGNFLVAFTDQGRDASQLPQSYARLFSWDLQSISDDFPLEAVSVGNQWSQTPRVSMAAGTIVGSYSVYTTPQDPSGWAAYLQRFSYAVNATTGTFDVTPVGNPIMPYLNGTGDQGVTPVVAADGSFTAVIDNVPSGTGSEDIYLRRFAADATPLDAALVPVTTAAGDQWTNGAGLDGSGNLYVSWRDGGYGNNWDLYARQFNSEAVPLTDPMRITPHTELFHWWSVGGIAVAPDGALTAVWTTYRPNADGFGVEARHYDPILASATETDTLTDVSTGDQVSVTSTATTSADSVLWEYRVTNNGSADLGQFSVSGEPQEVTDASNSLGWNMNSTGTGWTAGSGQPLLAPGQEAYFTFSTPSAYTAGRVAAQAGGGSSTATGTVAGPSPTVTETTTLTMADGFEPPQYVQVTSSATIFPDHILWQYQVTNQSYIGESDSPAPLPAYYNFDLPLATGTASNVIVPGGWDWTNTGDQWVAETVDNNPVGVGGTAGFSFTTPVTAVGQVWAGAGQGHWGSAASGYIFGAVDHFISMDLDEYIPLNADNDNGSAYVRRGIPAVRDFNSAKVLGFNDPELKRLTIDLNAGGAAGTIDLSAVSAGGGSVRFWKNADKAGGVINSVPVPAQTNQVTVFVEGVRQSKAVGDIDIFAQFKSTDGTKADKVDQKVTVTPIVVSFVGSTPKNANGTPAETITFVNKGFNEAGKPQGPNSWDGLEAQTADGKDGIRLDAEVNNQGLSSEVKFVQDVSTPENGANQHQGGGWVFTNGVKRKLGPLPGSGLTYPALDILPNATTATGVNYLNDALPPTLQGNTTIATSDGPSTGYPTTADRTDRLTPQLTSLIDVKEKFTTYLVVEYTQRNGDFTYWSIAYVDWTVNFYADQNVNPAGATVIEDKFGVVPKAAVISNVNPPKTDPPLAYGNQSWE